MALPDRPLSRDALEAPHPEVACREALGLDSPTDWLTTRYHRALPARPAQLCAVRCTLDGTIQGGAYFSGNNLPCTLLPPDIDQTIHQNPTYEQARIKQSEVFQQSWFVMSWARDPALLHESHNYATFIGDYLESVLLARYDIHHAFVLAKTAVEKSAASDWRDAEGFRNGTGKIASVRTFSFKQLRNDLSSPPTNDPRRATYERMLGNFARMWIYLVEDDLKQSGEIYDRAEVLYAVRYMRTWVAQLEGQEDAGINAAVLSIEKLAPSAAELRSQKNRDDHPGTGLQPNGTWAEFAQPYTG